MLPALPTGMHSASSSAVEGLVDLERGRLLAFDAELVDRVDEHDRVGVGQLAHERERLVEVALERDHARAVHQRLRHLALRDLALGHDHRAGDARARRVRGGARGGVAGRGADHRLGAFAHGGRDRAGHAAVLERAGRVGALELQAHGRADHLREHRRAQQRRRALLQADERVAGRERQALAVALDQRHVRARERRAFDRRQRVGRPAGSYELLFDHADGPRRRAHEVEARRPARSPRAGSTRAPGG